MKTTLLCSIAVAMTLGCALRAVAGEENLDIDTKFRAKIAKEKIKQAALERKLDKDGQALDANATCGSQNIGNVTTSGRPGAAPREVFVFAPNAINLVSNGGCR